MITGVGGQRDAVSHRDLNIPLDHHLSRLWPLSEGGHRATRVPGPAMRTSVAGASSRAAWA